MDQLHEHLRLEGRGGAGGILNADAIEALCGLTDQMHRDLQASLTTEGTDEAAVDDDDAEAGGTGYAHYVGPSEDLQDK